MLFCFLPEFWEEHFQCKYPDSARTPFNLNFTVPCNRSFHLGDKKPMWENQLQFVSDSVLAFAHALYDMHSVKCKNVSGLCEQMKPVKGPELLEYLKKVNFKGEWDETRARLFGFSVFGSNF